jgi:hypothetical protein
MSYSYTIAEAFTVTHARHMAAKLATDLKRMQRFYGRPTDAEIADYEREVIEFLKEGYLGAVTYGFQRDGYWIEPTLRYTARDLGGDAASDDDPGRIRPGADITNARFHSYLTYDATWNRLSETEKQTFRQRLPFPRGGASEPSVNGYLSHDRVYSSGGRALDRASVRSFR